MSRATVTVRELKNKDTGIDITIPSHKEVKGLLHSSYEYQVVVVSILPYFKSPNHKDTDVVQFMVSRKFADFEQLHSQMSEKFSGTALPVLPKKVLLVSDQVAKERRTGLEIIMKFLASVPKLSTSSVLLEFLGVNAIKAGKFRKDQVESGALTSREQQSDTKSEIKEENGGGQGPPHSLIVAKMDIGVLIANNDRLGIKVEQARLKQIIEANAQSLPNRRGHGDIDNLAKVLLPADVPFPLESLLPIKTTGNGNCLLNAASICLIGNETLSKELRHITAMELFLNAEQLSEHPIFKSVSNKEDAKYVANTYIGISLPDAGLKNFDEHGDFSRAIESIALATLKENSWSSLIHMIALSSAIKKSIYSIYPNSNKCIRPLFNTEITPLEKEDGTKGAPIIIMWSRDCNLDDRCGAVFEPNHFVAIEVQSKEQKPDLNTFENDDDDDVWLSSLDLNAKTDLHINLETTKTETIGQEKEKREVGAKGEVVSAMCTLKHLAISESDESIQNIGKGASIQVSGKCASGITYTSQKTYDDLPPFPMSSESTAESWSTKPDSPQLNSDMNSETLDKKVESTTPKCNEETATEYDTSDDLPLSALASQKSKIDYPPLSKLYRDLNADTSCKEADSNTKLGNEEPSHKTDTEYDTADDLPLSAIASHCTVPVVSNAKLGEPTIPMIYRDIHDSDSVDNETLSSIITKTNRILEDEDPYLIHIASRKSYESHLSVKTDTKAKPQGNERSIDSKHKSKDRQKSVLPVKRKASDISFGDEENEIELEEDMFYESDAELQHIAELNSSDTDSGDEGDNEEDNDGCNRFTWTHKLQRIPKKNFTGPTPGSVHQMADTSSELEYFFEICPRNIFEVMAKSTNAYVPIYAASRRKHLKDESWIDNTYKDVTTEDIKAYIAVRMLMALDPKFCLDDYWSTHPAFNNQIISGSMSRSRFKSIQRYFHVNDPRNDPSRISNTTEARENIRKDPLYKISPLMESVRKNSIRKYNLHREVSVDEAMIKCHGQHWSIVGAPNKPAKRGFKVFVAADAVSGYLWNFQVYIRKQKEIGLTKRVVENLTEDIVGRNHVIYVDKFYTSIPLALSLLQNSTYICGSFNTGRKYWPADLKQDKRKKKSEDKVRSLKRGEFLTRQTSDGKIVATVWQDSRLVSNLSTYHNPITNARRDKVSRKSINKEGRWQTADFPCPESIVEFNKFMGGVDRHDHLRSNYTLQRASTKWWTYFAWFALDMAIINSFILYKSKHPKATHKKYQLRVAEQLLGGYNDRIRTPKQVDTLGNMSTLFAASHESAIMPGRARVCRYCRKMKSKTSAGRTRETTYGCSQCGINLHRECFIPYHQMGIQKSNTSDVSTQTEIKTGQLCRKRKEEDSTPGTVPAKLLRSNSPKKSRKATGNVNKDDPPRRCSPRKKAARGLTYSNGLFEDEDNEENEDGVNFFSVDNTEEKGEDYHGKEDDAKLFDDQDFGVAFHKEEAYSVLLVPEANAVTKSEQAFATEDNSELLQVDDDLDFLISNTLSLAEVKSKASVKEESKATGDHPSKETQRPAIKDKPKVITRSKPAISPKPMIENSTKTKPTIPTHPQSKEKYVHTKPAIKPRPAPKPKPEEDVITAGNNKNISKLDTSDILQYIDANTEEEDVDLFS